MTHPHPDANAATPEGYEPLETPQHQGGLNPAGPQQQPYQQPQHQGYPAGPQQPYQQPQHQPYGGPQQPYQYQGTPPSSLQPQYQQHPAMPNPAYGYPQAKSKVVAGLLGIFLGGLGIHRFYLGFTKVAVIQLVLTLVVSIFTLGFGLFLVGLWGFIEGIMILAGSANFQRDAHGIPLRD